MNHRERLLTALGHNEPDHVPYDLGAHGSTGIHVGAYRELRAHLGLPERPVNICHTMQQLAQPEEDLLQILQADVRRLERSAPSNWTLKIEKEDGLNSYTDEFGVCFKMPVEGGLYFDPRGHPLADAEGPEDIQRYPWPDPTDPARYTGIVQQARALRERSGAAVALGSICAGPLEMGQWLRGFDTFLMDLFLNPAIAQAIVEKITEIKVAYWDCVLPLVKDYVDVVGESDDLGSQDGPIISPELYRRYLKPAHTRVFATMRRYTQAPIYLHSCGSVRELIPDFIESGVNILNPVQVSAAHMDTRELKADFGDDIVFWGGGCDTQSVLAHGTRQQIRDEVKRRIDDLAPGGGFVFTPVHNIQSDVPPENVVIMWEAWQEFGAYGRH